MEERICWRAKYSLINSYHITNLTSRTFQGLYEPFLLLLNLPVIESGLML